MAVFPTLLNVWRFLKRPGEKYSLILHVLPPLILECTIIRHSSIPSGQREGHPSSEVHDYPPHIGTKSGHRHHTGGRPFDQTKYAQAELLAHIGRANGSLLTIDCIEQTLTQTNILGRNLDQFVVDDILQSLF